jgi:GT2 family glycosyltransferase
MPNSISIFIIFSSPCLIPCEKDIIPTENKLIPKQNIKANIKVFDNNSTDNTIQILKKYIPPNNNNFTYFKNITNIGFGKACNYFAKQSKADIILFMNPDLEIVTENTLQTIKDKLNTPEIIGVGVAHIDYNNTIRTKGVKGSIINHYDRTHGDYDNKCLYVSGGFLAVRNEDLKAVNYFDEQYFLYWEDFDLALKLYSKYPDSKIISLDDYIVKHKFQGSNIDKELRMKYIMQSKEIFYKKWIGCDIKCL